MLVLVVISQAIVLLDTISDSIIVPSLWDSNVDISINASIGLSLNEVNLERWKSRHG
jgi:hypothetical protein